MKKGTAKKLDDWQREIEGLTSFKSDKGMTPREIATAIGAKEYAVGLMLAEIHRAGKLQHGRRKGTGIDGRTIWHSVYSLRRK